MAQCPSCGFQADSIQDLDFEGEGSTVGDSGEAIVAMMVCPDCESILGFATGGGIA